MAARGVSKIPSAGKARSGTGAATLEARLAALEAERDALKAQLAKATGRIAELEALKVQTANRIAWVIDSIHNLLEDHE